MFKHIQRLQLQGEVPDYIEVGRQFHRLAQEIHTSNQVRISDLVEPLPEMVLAYSNWLLHEEPNIKFLQAEQPLGFRLSSDILAVIKPDAIIQRNGDKWLYELKTSSGWGSQMARHYWNSAQLAAYAYVAFRLLRVTKLLLVVVTKRNIRVVPEEILFHSQLLARGQNIWRQAANYLKMVQQYDFPQNFTACHSYFGGECPYYPLCFLDAKPDEWFRVADPLDYIFGED
jgi:hypothetical protein